MVRLSVRAIALFEYGLWHRLQTKVLVVAGGVQSIFIANCVELLNVNVRFLGKARAIARAFYFLKQ